MIEIHDLHKAYTLPGGGVAEVLRGVDLLVPDRCITAVVGPSGSGKTTLSRCISLLDRPTAGSILVNGTDLSHLAGGGAAHAAARDRHHLPVGGTAPAQDGGRERGRPLRYLGVTEAGIRRRVAELLDSVGLPDKADHYPGQLSGGQRQRIGIARALALGPPVLLSDEATSGLDPQATQSILALLRKLRDQFSLSVILITHEMDVVRGTADQVAVLRGGRIVERGSVAELVADPASATGGHLLPVAAPLSDDPELLQLELRYAADRPVPPDWISRLGEALPVRVSLLGGSVEASAGGTIGRLRVGVRWQPGAPPATEAVPREVSRFGLHATVLRSPTLHPVAECTS